MKLYSVLASIGLAVGVAGVANAQITRGSMEAYFTKVYATDLTGKNRLMQFDEACRSKNVFLINSHFFVDYRVNTDAVTQSAFFNFGNFEHLLTGTYDGYTGMYVFKTEQLSPSLKDMRAKTLVFSATRDLRQGSAQLIFEPTQVTRPTDLNSTKDCPPGCDCCKPPAPTDMSYQCVLST